MISKLRERFRVNKYAAIERRNREADWRVIVDLGLVDQFTEDYATTGTSGGDIAFIHDYIKSHQPRRVIEFGSGKSTWVIAKCMERYCWPRYNGDIQFVSMEESKYWYDQLLKFLPKDKFEHFDDFVKLVYSETEIIRCRHVSGYAYKDIPVEHFDFCFVDGPDAYDSCDMDFVRLVGASERPMTALVDKRKSTQIAYASLFGKSKMKRFHTGLCLIENVSKSDLERTAYKDIFPENEIVLRH